MFTWIKLADNYYTNPKLVRAGEAAELLWVRGLCYCSNQLTDGRIPAEMVAILARKPASTAMKIARTLVKVGLWYEDSEGFVVNDYAEYQRTNAQVRTQREDWARRKRQQRTKADVPPMSKRDSKQESQLESSGSHADVPLPESESESETESEEINQNPRETRDVVHSRPPGGTFTTETGAVCMCGHPIQHDDVFGWLHVDFAAYGQSLDHRPAPAQLHRGRNRP